MNTTTPTAPPLIAALIHRCDAYSALVRAALAALDDAPQLRELAARARTLDRQRDALLHQLAQAGYTQATVEQAVLAAGRTDVLDDLSDTLDELAE